MHGGLMQLVAYGAQDIYFNNRNFNNAGMLYSPHVKKISKQQKQRIKCAKKFKNFRKHDKYDQHICCICLDKYRAEEFVSVRYCGHIYHEKCNKLDLVACPICRRI